MQALVLLGQFDLHSKAIPVHLASSPFHNPNATKHRSKHRPNSKIIAIIANILIREVLLLITADKSGWRFEMQESDTKIFQSVNGKRVSLMMHADMPHLQLGSTKSYSGNREGQHISTWAVRVTETKQQPWLETNQRRQSFRTISELWKACRKRQYNLQCAG